MNYILGIDIGTSGCKLVLLDEAGNLNKTIHKELFPITKSDGTVEQNPNDWYLAITDCLREMRLYDNINLENIVAIGVTGQMQGISVVDENCEPIRNSILWNDIRNEVETAEIREKYQGVFEKIIGYSLSTGLTLSKILWLKRHEPENWEKTFKFLHSSNFIIAKLTGRMSADNNNIGQSGLNDIRTNSWSMELIKKFGVETDKVPELICCFEVVGTITEKAAQESGLRVGTKVIAAGGDSGAESFSISLADSDRMKVRLGTAGDMNVVLHESKLDQDSLHGLRDVMPGFLLIGAYTRACAFSIKWARSLFYSEMASDESTYIQMDDDASHIPLGSDGLIYYPYLYGEASPYFSSTITAKFHGMRGGMERSHFVRAVYEGVSFSIRDVIRSTPEFKFAKQYVLVGGGTKSKLWVSIIADVLGHDLLIPKNCDAAYGAALIAGDGAGIWNGRTLANQNVADHILIKHVPENHQIYNGQFEKYLEFAGK